MLAGYVAAGISTLWNLDTGVIVLVAWGVVLAFDAFARNGSLWPRRARPCTPFMSCLPWRFPLPPTHRSHGFVPGIGPSGDSFTDSSNSTMARGPACCQCALWEFWQPLILVYAVTVFVCMHSCSSVASTEGPKLVPVPGDLRLGHLRLLPGAKPHWGLADCDVARGGPCRFLDLGPATPMPVHAQIRSFSSSPRPVRHF